MKRRTILRQLGVGGLLGVGGCVDTPSAESRSSATSTTPPRERLQRHISLAREESVPDTCPVRVETEVLKSTITDTHTARIRVTITNDGPAREISVSTGGCSLFNRWSQTSQPRGLWLGFADEPQYVTKQGPQWVADPPEKGFPDYGCAGRTYASGESVHNEYGIYHDGRVGGYLESGTYRFAEEFTISKSGEQNTGESISYAFVLTLENPNCTLCF
jgi:hypothetical protein